MRIQEKEVREQYEPTTKTKFIEKMPGLMRNTVAPLNTQESTFIVSCHQTTYVFVVTTAVLTLIKARCQTEKTKGPRWQNGAYATKRIAGPYI